MNRSRQWPNNGLNAWTNWGHYCEEHTHTHTHMPWACGVMDVAARCKDANVFSQTCISVLLSSFFGRFTDSNCGKVELVIQSTLLMRGSIVQRDIFMFQHLNKWCIWLYIKYDTLLTSSRVSHEAVCCVELLNVSRQEPVCVFHIKEHLKKLMTSFHNARMTQSWINKFFVHLPFDLYPSHVFVQALFFPAIPCLTFTVWRSPSATTVFHSAAPLERRAVSCLDQGHLSSARGRGGCIHFFFFFWNCCFLRWSRTWNLLPSDNEPSFTVWPPCF